MYLDYVGKDTFYGLLASLRGQLFRDDDFAEIYCPDNGRDSVPPSLLATALLLQTYDKVSDAEAKARADQVPVETHVSLNVLDHEHIEDFATFTVPSLVGRTSSISHLDCLRRASARISPQASICFR